MSLRPHGHLIWLYWLLTLFHLQSLILYLFLGKKDPILSSKDLENHVYPLEVLSQSLTLSANGFSYLIKDEDFYLCDTSDARY